MGQPLGQRFARQIADGQDADQLFLFNDAETGNPVFAHLLRGGLNGHGGCAGHRVGDHQCFHLHAGQVKRVERIICGRRARSVKETAEWFMVCAQFVKDGWRNTDQAAIILGVSRCDCIAVFDQAALSERIFALELGNNVAVFIAHRDLTAFDDVKAVQLFTQIVDLGARRVGPKHHIFPQRMKRPVWKGVIRVKLLEERKCGVGHSDVSRKRILLGVGQQPDCCWPDFLSDRQHHLHRQGYGRFRPGL